jgi:hypothetical protein
VVGKGATVCALAVSKGLIDESCECAFRSSFVPCQKGYHSVTSNMSCNLKAQLPFLVQHLVNWKELPGLDCSKGEIRKSDNQMVITVSHSYHRPVTCTDACRGINCFPVIHVIGPAVCHLCIHAVASHQPQPYIDLSELSSCRLKG